jgi:hypothetical protein
MLVMCSLIYVQIILVLSIIELLKCAVLACRVCVKELHAFFLVMLIDAVSLFAVLLPLDGLTSKWLTKYYLSSLI